MAGWQAMRATRVTRAPLRTDVANATGDRMQTYIEGELARRMAGVRRQPAPDLGRRVLRLSELRLEDEDLYDWLPDAGESRLQYARRTKPDLVYQNFYHANYHTNDEHPHDEGIEKIRSLIRDKMYRSREMIDELMPDFDKYKDSLKLRFAFVFRRLDNLLDEMAAIYSYMSHKSWRVHVLRHVFYHQHMLRRHVDVVYIAERTMAMYMWYKERERRLNSILAERMQTEADYAS